jgi:hypothetical protein
MEMALLSEEEREYVLWNLRNQLPSSFSHSPSSKKEYHPFRQIYWEDPHLNPQIVSPGIDGIPDQSPTTLNIPSSNTGQIWGKEKRFKRTMKDPNLGPSKSLEYPHLSEKPIVHFERNRQILTPHSRLAPKPKCQRNVCPVGLS